MEKTSVAKAVTAVVSGLATIFATVFSADISWLTPELTVSIGTGITAFLVWMVPNDTVE